VEKLGPFLRASAFLLTLRDHSWLALVALALLLFGPLVAQLLGRLLTPAADAAGARLAHLVRAPRRRRADRRSAKAHPVRPEAKLAPRRPGR
jgi:hypothetical protein